MKIEKTNTTPYHPHTNIQVEVYKKTNAAKLLATSGIAEASSQHHLKSHLVWNHEQLKTLILI
jgi:hypothetical protein